MKYVVSVSKTYKHRGLRRHKLSTKKFWHIYYYDEYNVFHCEQANFFVAMYYKLNKWHKMKYVCFECGSMWYALVKKKKQELECPYCE